MDVQEMQVNWWGMTLRGIATLLFGIAAVFWPGITLLTVIYIFSALILVSGIVRIITGIGRIGRHQLGFLTMLLGLVEMGVGVYLVRHPAVTFTTLILIIGFTLIAGGVVEIVNALTARASATGKTLAIIVGAASLLAGILMLFQPVASGVAFVWILGLYGLISGPLLIALSLDIHRKLEAAGR